MDHERLIISLGENLNWNIYIVTLPSVMRKLNMNYKIWRKKWFQICLCKKYFINLKWDKKSYHKSILEKIFYWKTTGNPIKSWTKKDSHQKLKTTLLSRKWKSSLYCKFWSNFLIGVYKILTLSNQSLMKIFTVNTTGGGGGLGWILCRCRASNKPSRRLNLYDHIEGC